MTEQIYAAAYPIYRDLGWAGTIKLQAATKDPPPAGFTGHEGAYPSGADCHAWAQEEPDGNIAIRLDECTIGIDCDDWGDKTGPDTIAEAENSWGRLPYSPASTSRPGTKSRVRFYRIPAGIKLRQALGPGVEILQRHHRYAVCWPSIHPKTGQQYQWYGIDGTPIDPPAYDDIPDLPTRWLDELTEPAHNGADLGGQPADPTIVDAAITEGEPSHRVSLKLGQALTALHNGDCRHDATRDAVLGLLRCGKQGDTGVKTALQALRKAFGDVAAATGRDGGRERALREFREFIYQKVDGRWVARGEVARLLADSSYDDWAQPGEPPPDDDDHHGGEYDESGSGGSEPTTWEPLDLGPWLRGEVEQPQPTLGIVRSDGLRLIYPGREHAFLGETESGKTWLALGCVVAELIAGNTVVYIHYEEGDPGSTIDRLRLLGIDAHMIGEGLRFVAPNRPVRGDWIKPLLDPAPTLVIHDGINEAMSLIGADIMAADGAATFRRKLVTPFLRVGAATIACDHLPKDRDGHGRSRDAYGSVHKGNALDGARIVLDNVEPFGRDMRGVSHVFVTKDRPGHLRAHGRPTRSPGRTYMGTLVVDDMAGGPDFMMRLWAPKDDDGDQPGGLTVTATDLGDAMYEVIAALPDRTAWSSRKLFAAMRAAGHKFRESAYKSTVDDLIVAGRVIEVQGRNRATGYCAVASAAQESDL